MNWQGAEWPLHDPLVMSTGHRQQEGPRQNPADQQPMLLGKS